MKKVAHAWNADELVDILKTSLRPIYAALVERSILFAKECERRYAGLCAEEVASFRAPPAERLSHETPVIAQRGLQPTRRAE